MPFSNNGCSWRPLNGGSLNDGGFLNQNRSSCDFFNWSFHEDILHRIEQFELELQAPFQRISRISYYNQLKMLYAFQRERIGTHHFHTSTGYGYHDPGREALERVFARVFKSESALVRQQLVSGTHAIACALLGNLKPADELLVASGTPYETLLGVLGIQPDLPEGGVHALISETGGFRVKIVPLQSDGSLNLPLICSNISSQTKLIAFQRSCGYSKRASFGVEELSRAFASIRCVKPDAVIFVDNCYGEFVEEREPIEAGADLIAGSLIKNPGGCLIPTGGYIAGNRTLVRRAAERLYAPNIGGAIGPSLVNPQLFFQGFFEAPHRVGEMLKGAILAAKLFEKAGFKVAPGPEEIRADIIQKIYLNSAEELIEFCRAVQRNSPVEAEVLPEPAAMPGYHHQVIMGGGTFISGSTSEFSADAPLTPPYIAFLQGGLSYTQIKVSLAGLYALFCKGG
ncbi:MAG: methionine gamma-lyase family protein [Firmicutes bacterium]|nr:methionine gamma-lyase family protein [Bacillota bacterium]